MNTYEGNIYSGDDEVTPKVGPCLVNGQCPANIGTCGVNASVCVADASLCGLNTGACKYNASVCGVNA